MASSLFYPTISTKICDSSAGSRFSGPVTQASTRSHGVPRRDILSRIDVSVFCVAATAMACLRSYRDGAGTVLSPPSRTRCSKTYPVRCSHASLLAAVLCSG